VQLSILAKGHKRREVLLPEVVGAGFSPDGAALAPMTQFLLRLEGGTSGRGPSTTCSIVRQPVPASTRNPFSSRFFARAQTHS
jgi:hypothetical protein